MPTLIKMELDVPRILVKLTDNVVNLKKYTGGNIDGGLFVLADGFVYHYQGIYAFSDSHNKVKEVIIADGNKIGLILIDTKQASKRNKSLIKKIEEFLEILYKTIGDITQNDMSNVQIMQDRYIAELKEELLIQHAV